jgi:hypothetical protein
MSVVVEEGMIVQFLGEYPVEILPDEKRSECKEIFSLDPDNLPVLAKSDSPKFKEGDLVLIPRVHLFLEKKQLRDDKKPPYPEGQVRYYGGYHPVEILPYSEYENCSQMYVKYKNTPLEEVKSVCYPCLVLSDFETGAGRAGKGRVFKKGEKVFLRKQYCHGKSKVKVTQRI